MLFYIFIAFYLFLSYPIESFTILKLPCFCVDVFFENEDIHNKDTSSRFLITLLESFAQAESESRSHNIKWGIKRKSESGISKLYNRKCFGYGKDNEGTLIIIDDEALTVKRIFDLYLSGYSILGIIHELENNGIKSPTGRDRFSKTTIELMLTNEKYSGNVLLGKHTVKTFLTINVVLIMTKVKSIIQLTITFLLFQLKNLNSFRKKGLNEVILL